MKKTAEHGENVKHNIQGGPFYSRAAEKSSDGVSKASYRNNKERLPVKVCQKRNGAEQHHRSPDKINRHHRRLEFFKEKQLCGYAEQGAEPRDAENEQKV